MQTGQLIRRALDGYQEHLYKLVEVGGGKVKRDGGAPVAQGVEQIADAMSAWVAATRRPGVKSVTA